MADEDVESPGEPRLIPSPIITAIPRAASTEIFFSPTDSSPRSPSSLSPVANPDNQGQLLLQSSSPALRTASPSAHYAIMETPPGLKQLRMKPKVDDDDGEDSARHSPRLIDIGPQTTPTLRSQKDIDSFVNFFKEFDKNNDGEIDEEEMAAISRDVLSTKFSLSRFKATAILVAGMIVLFLIINMGLTAFVLFLYKDMTLSNSGNGGKVLVTPSKSQAIRVKSAESQVHQDALTKADSSQVLGTTEFVYRKNLSMDITIAEALALHTLRIRLPHIEYVYKVESTTRKVASDSAVVESLLIKTATNASIEITEAAITATTPQGFTLWRLTNHLDRNNAASAQDTANDWEAVAYFGASHQSTATRKERSIEQDALDIQQFNASINQLKAQYDEELARLLSISNSIQESKSTRIDELRAEIADMQQALGIT